jgi:DNA polymerase III subunit epsilon
MVNLMQIPQQIPGVIVDTETTGLTMAGEICEIGIIDAVTGEILLSTLVKPMFPIPADASAIHGITNEAVADAPSWVDLFGHFVKAVHGQKIFAYNAQFDFKMVAQSSEKHGLPDPKYPMVDVMKPYAKMFGEPGRYKDPKWQKLTKAAADQGIDISDLQAHRAVSDCEITRRLMHKMRNNDIKTFKDLYKKH